MSIEVVTSPRPEEVSLEQVRDSLLCLTENLLHPPAMSDADQAASMHAFASQLGARIPYPGIKDYFLGADRLVSGGIPLHKGLGASEGWYAMGRNVKNKPQDHVRALTGVIASADHFFSSRDKADLIVAMVKTASGPVLDPEGGNYMLPIAPRALAPYKARRAVVWELRGMIADEQTANQVGESSILLDSLERLLTEVQRRWQLKPEKLVAAAAGITGAVAAVALGRRLHK